MSKVASYAWVGTKYWPAESLADTEDCVYRLGDTSGEEGSLFNAKHPRWYPYKAINALGSG